MMLDIARKQFLTNGYCLFSERVEQAMTVSGAVKG